MQGYLHHTFTYKLKLIKKKLLFDDCSISKHPFIQIKIIFDKNTKIIIFLVDKLVFKHHTNMYNFKIIFVKITENLILKVTQLVSAHVSI